MKKFLHDIKKVTAGWLLIFFVGYVACVTLFYHTHIIEGARVTHSHPYSEAPDTGRHAHSGSELAVIAHLSVILMLAASFGCGFEVRLRDNMIGYAVWQGSSFSATLSVPVPRGPPVCLA